MRPFFFGYFDESGKWNDHEIVAFAGLVAREKNWRPFNDDWDYLLRHHRVGSLHMTGGGLNFKRNVLAKSPVDFKGRLEILTRFIECIKRHVEFGVATAVDVKAFGSLDSESARRLGRDPNLVAFKVAITDALAYVRAASSDAVVSLICDDEEQYAIHFLKYVKELKKDSFYRKQIGALCFGDDFHHPQLQAADLFAHILRAQAQKYFFGTPYRYEELHNVFTAYQKDAIFTFSGNLLNKAELIGLSMSKDRRTKR